MRYLSSIAIVALLTFLQGCGGASNVDCSSQKSYDSSLADVLGAIDDKYPNKASNVRKFVHDRSNGTEPLKEICGLGVDELANKAGNYQENSLKQAVNDFGDAVSDTFSEIGSAVMGLFSSDKSSQNASSVNTSNSNASKDPNGGAVIVEEGNPSYVNPKTTNTTQNKNPNKSIFETTTVPKIDCQYGDHYQRSLKAVFKDLEKRSPDVAKEVQKRLKAKHMESGLGNSMDQELCGMTPRDLTTYVASDLVNKVNWDYATDRENANNAWGKLGDDMKKQLDAAGDSLEEGWNNMKKNVDGYFEERKKTNSNVNNEPNNNK